MTPKEVRELSVSAYKGKYGPGKQHPEQLLRAGSILTFEGTDFAIPPLYPKGGVSIIPTFEDNGDITLESHTDLSVVDAELVKLATSILSKITVEGEVLQIDPTADLEVIKMLFAYARKCLLYLYDLSNEQLAELLKFDRSIPKWVTQVIDHVAQQPGD